MLLDDDVVTDRQAEARAFASRLGGEERIEHLFANLWRNPNTIVPYPDLHAVAEAIGRSRNGGLEAIAALLPLALACRVEAVRDQVEENPSDLLGKTSISPAAGSKERSKVTLKPCFSALAP